jgi:hypothetical protein
MPLRLVVRCREALVRVRAAAMSSVRGALVATLVWMTSCVGGSSSNGVMPGTDGGPCLSNNTCNAGLTCALQGGTGICVPADAGSADSGSNADSGNDSGCTPCVLGSTALGACCIH